jgi:hypothetical protein
MSLLVGMLTIMLVLSGCGSAKKDPKEALQLAMENAAKLSSYEFNTSFIINDLSVTSPEITTNPEIGMVYNMLKNAQVTVKGAYQKDPMQLEMNVDLTIKGDASFTLNIPVVMTTDKMWVKIPNIPMLPLPENLVGKFVEVDLKKLAEEAGNQATVGAMDTVKAQELGKEIMKIVFDKFDGKTFFQEVDTKDVTVPAGIEAKQVIKLAVTNENLDQGLTTLVKDVLPPVLDLLASDKYKDVVGVTIADVEEAKKSLSDEAELKKGLEELKKTLKINDFNIITALNKDNYPAYQEANVKADVTSDGESVKLDLKLTSETTNINGKPNFTITTPPADVIPMDELSQMFGGVGAGQ